MLIEIPQEKSTESKTINIRELIFKTVYPEKNNLLNKEKNDGKRKTKKDDILNKINICLIKIISQFKMQEVIFISINFLKNLFLMHLKRRIAKFGI